MTPTASATRRFVDRVAADATQFDINYAERQGAGVKNNGTARLSNSRATWQTPSVALPRIHCDCSGGARNARRLLATIREANECVFAVNFLAGVETQDSRALSDIGKYQHAGPLR